MNFFFFSSTGRPTCRWIASPSIPTARKRRSCRRPRRGPEYPPSWTKKTRRRRRPSSARPRWRRRRSRRRWGRCPRACRRLRLPPRLFSHPLPRRPCPETAPLSWSASTTTTIERRLASKIQIEQYFSETKLSSEPSLASVSEWPRITSTCWLTRFILYFFSRKSNVQHCFADEHNFSEKICLPTHFENNTSLDLLSWCFILDSISFWGICPFNLFFAHDARVKMFPFFWTLGLKATPEKPMV